jgi:uncharacterized protein (DUF488 family)
VTIFTIGHSIRPLPEFLRLLDAHNIVQLADVRTVPKSRRHPHFAREALQISLPEKGIAYRHFPTLGGLRKPRPDSRNNAWRVDGFRGYADYMETPEFEAGLQDLVEWARLAGDDRRTAVMCAEAVWWRCHRQLIADALVARGIEVRHISTASSAPVHTLTDFARLNKQRVTYPGVLLVDERAD